MFAFGVGEIMLRIKSWLAVLIIGALAGCSSDQKIWILVSVKKLDGQLAQVGFDDPSGADKDVQTCSLSLKTAGADLMQEIDGMPDFRGSHFLSAKCVQSDKNPAPNQV